MAPANRHAHDPLMRQLQQQGARFEYFQVVRLLRLLGVHIGCAAPEPHLRTRPALWLASAASEVQRVQRVGDGRWQVTVHCFGLYGSTSPLPIYYTEDLLEEQREGRHAARGLIDILHHALYPLLFESWEKYRLAQRVCEADDDRALRFLHAFGGLAHATPGRHGATARLPVLRYLPLLQQGPRSASGLRRLLSLELQPATVQVIQHVRRMLPIPAAQRTRIGEGQHRLGVESRVGSHLDDACATIAVRVHDLDIGAFQQLLPGRPGRQRMQQLMRLYLRDSLHVQLQLQLRADAQPPALRLGARQWARIGFDAWLAQPAGCAALAHAGQWQAHEPAEVA